MVILFILLLTYVYSLPIRSIPKEDKYTEIVNLINRTISSDPEFKHHSYDTTSFLVDTFGPRLWGSEQLELAIQYMHKLLISDGFEEVKLEEVQIKEKWVRGKEQLTLLSPRPVPTNIPMIGLGLSVGGDVIGDIVMIRNWGDLEKEANKNNIQGKIVFYNPEWTTYGEMVEYRINGASLASKYGATGVIIRSIAPKGNSPHTGMMNYDVNYKKIPAAAVSSDIADMFARMINRGDNVRVHLYMEAHTIKGDFKSYNLIGQITGTTYPDQILLMGGHIDSWDSGPQTGANDDASGFMVCYEAIRLLLKKGLRPKRTIRFIAWSGEEMGQPTSGSFTYAKNHNLDNHVLAFESDEGVSDLFGFGFSGGLKGFNLVDKVANLFLKDLNMNYIRYNDGVMVDTTPIHDTGVPVMRNLVKDTPDSQDYFTVHHSTDDNMNILNPDSMDRNVIGIASMFYILADVPWKLPRD